MKDVIYLQNLSIETFSSTPAAMQEAPGRTRAATCFGFEIGFIGIANHQRLPAPDVHEEDEDNDRGQLDQGDGNKAGGWRQVRNLKSIYICYLT